MPAFTFEKISPPRRGPIAPIAKKQRGLVVAILDRFVEARAKRDGRSSGVATRPSRRPNPVSAQQQAAPAFDPEMPQRHQPARAIGGHHARRLVVQQSRQDHESLRREMPRHRPRELPQRIGEDVGQHQVERTVPARIPAPQKPVARIACTRLPHAVEPRVLARDPHRRRVDVARQHRAVQRLGGGDRQHAGAGAEIEHAPRPMRISGRDRAAAGSRAWCRDGRCRRRAPPRSRCRACSARCARGRARHARRSVRPGPARGPRGWP